MRQLTQPPAPARHGGGVLGVLALLPGLPALPFLLPAAGARRGGVPAERARRAAAPPRRSRRRRRAAGPESGEALLPLDPLELEVGYGLLPLVEPGRRRAATSSSASARCAGSSRSSSASIVPPDPHPRQRRASAPTSTRSAARRRGRARRGASRSAPRHEPADTDDGVDGLEVARADLRPARALDREGATAARRRRPGYTVVDASTVVVTHLSETIRRHGTELLGRQEVQALLDRCARRIRRSSRSSCPRVLPLGAVHRVLQRLLARACRSATCRSSSRCSPTSRR